MKKVFMTLFVIIIMTINASAQYKPFQFGLKIEPGLSVTQPNSDNFNKGANKLSFGWGFNGNFYFVENYGFSTGFNVRNISGNYTYSDNEVGDVSCNIDNKYLEIPLSLIMRTEKIGEMRIVGNIGYGLGICLNDSQKHIYGNEEFLDMEIPFSKVRNALIIKLGVEYNVYKSSCLTAAFVFNNNFSNIYKNSNSLEHNVMLNNLCLEIGFMF